MIIRTKFDRENHLSLITYHPYKDKQMKAKFIKRILYLGLAFLVILFFTVLFKKYDKSKSQHKKMLINRHNMTAKDPRDGQKYKVVIIGAQVWLAENFNFDSGVGCFCYDDEEVNCEKFGKLYTWEVAQNIAPNGWHIPSKSDWESLLNTLEGNNYSSYDRIIQGGESGFDALFSGFRIGTQNYADKNQGTAFWTSTESNSEYASACYVYKNLCQADMISYKKSSGFSLRLIQDQK